jgi:NAD(P)-dependent dehydrogenase (short-subunit alcohol dehydrogenase family)
LSIRLGLKIVVSDIAKEALEELGKTLVRIVGEGNVLVVPTDVTKLEDVVRLRDKVYEAWGEVSVVANIMLGAEQSINGDGHRSQSCSTTQAWVQRGRHGRGSRVGGGCLMLISSGESVLLLCLPAAPLQVLSGTSTEIHCGVRVES